MYDHVMNDADSPHPNIRVYIIAKRPYSVNDNNSINILNDN